MPLHIVLELSYLSQTIALSLSIFNLVAFLWLAGTVWLNGDRRSLVARVGVVGLGLSALFFFIHALLIFGPPVRSSGLITPDFLWHIIWFPAVGVPYIWFIIGLHYAAQLNEGWRRRRPFLLVASGVLGCTVLTLLIYYRATFTFVGTLRLLAYGYSLQDNKHAFFSPLILVPILFLVHVTLCAIGPWFTPSRVGRSITALWQYTLRRSYIAPLRKILVEAFWHDPTRTEQLEEPMLSWHLARPALLLAALLMVGLTLSLGSLGVWSLIEWLENLAQIPAHAPPSIALNVLPLNLVLLDIFATGLVAIIILLIGYSIVRHGILIERPLARRGFFEQWRGIVIVAAVVATFIALLVDFTRSNLSGLLLITSLATCTYALFTWSSYTAHDRYSTLLGPFLRRTNLRHWLNTDLQKTEQGMQDLFFHLCKDVLGVECARLLVLSGPVKRSFHYRWSEQENATIEKPLVPVESAHLEQSLSQRVLTRGGIHRVRMFRQGITIICWVLPIYDELGLVAQLYLGPRQDGSIFTDEDMSLAHACGQRILDTLRDHEAMLAVAGLLRRRIVDVKLLGAQQRRVLHDEILPQMHLALLRLETLRPALNNEQERSAQALNEVINDISGAHRQLAAMMRATTTSAPHRLERDGMMHAIYTMTRQDFQQSFDEITWDVSEETMTQIDEIVPPAIAELIFAAVQEALRNAARHARGADVHRHLHVTIRATCDPDLELTVADDGVGVLSASSSTTGTGGGLLTHSALLAIAGGNLAINSAPDEGVTVHIFLPVEALR
ncbi:MAG TPA: ATP-binding protein [Ktedonobacteraceae bacterium]|jgi:signal transduction histidine kinase|nr:ATP-binding protein [Ktedonobacteraceae bacterium]